MLAQKVEMLIIYLYQAGQIKSKIDEEQLKAILEKLNPGRETRITRK